MTEVRPTRGLIHGLFEYMKWGDELMVEAAARVADDAYYLHRGMSHGSIHGLLVHGMAAQDVWLRRWRGEGEARIDGVAEYPTRAGLLGRWPDVHRALFEFLAGESDGSLERIVVARNTYGERFALPLGAMMLHVVDHATYHRGQINSMLKQAGVEPTAPYLQRFLAVRGDSVR
jgi:uncharacterized damage-inducible protein DinB